ncbi:coiled-coil domain-containing protein 191 [Gastrophryne carolinensis]
MPLTVYPACPSPSTRHAPHRLPGMPLTVYPAAVDYNNVESWIKRVEQASEFAISEVFSPKKPAQRVQRAAHPALDLQTTAQLHDHDDAYTEAQELLSDWLSNKLRLELASEDDEEPGDFSTLPAKPPEPVFTKYNRFDDLYQHLEQETDDTNTQDIIQKLLEKELVDSGILENLRSQRSERKSKRRDPRVAMEVRHQQVKENRARRQKELETLKQEKALKKSALAQAQLQVQEENRQKLLKAKKEEEEIQREAVKLRKEMNERKRAMDEARRLEWQRQQRERRRTTQESSETQREILETESEWRRQEKQAKIRELLSQLHADNQRCLQRCFSAWYKLVLERRLKMGRARALADWKLHQRAFRAWRQHVWSQKVERETQKMETELRDQNRKQQVAVESYHKRLLRHCLIEWQLWCRAEKEKRELEARKEETKRKMAALLEAASSARGQDQSPEDVGEGEAQSLKPIGPMAAAESSVVPGAQTPGPVHESPPATREPRHAWQVTRRHAALTPEDLKRPQRAGTPRTPQRTSAPYGENFENRHQFQQQLIEEQKRQLREQKEMIQELMENQRLMIVRQDAKRATAATAQLSGHMTAPRRRDSDPTVTAKHDGARRSSFSSASEPQPTSPAQSTVSTTRLRPGSLAAAHPAVKAMEERAAQRAERKRLLEELKRKREEEKLAQMRAAEEEKLQMEAMEREAQLERKREERRQQKLREEEKQRRLQREKELQEKATVHHRRALLKFRGLEPWKRLTAQRRHNMERAESHHHTTLLRGTLRAWAQAVTEIAVAKDRRAEEFYHTVLIRRSFRRWLKYRDYLSIQEERAGRRYRANLRRKIFTTWLDLTRDEKIAMWEKQREGAEHNQRRMLAGAFRTWRAFPRLMREQRMKEERREMLRKKVAEILPDFRIGADPKS